MQTGEDKRLLAYQINGQTCGVDINTWYNADLNGNSPFKIICPTDNIPSGYTDISSIEHWDEFGSNVATDYAMIKFSIKGIATRLGWTGITNAEKDLAITYYSYPDPTTAIIYLMTVKGMSQVDATAFLTLAWHKHHLKNIDAYSERWNYCKLTVLTYISRLDGEDLFTTVKLLIDLYIEVGVLGIEFNDNQNGIYDYTYSLNGFIDNGLEENDYILLLGTWDEFKDAITDVLVCGQYIKYED